MKILLIEDDPILGKNIQSFLEGEKHLCERATAFEDAEEKLHLYRYDIVLVDLGLPGGEGLDLVEIMRTLDVATGIIIISARNAVDDRIRGLEMGADDYLSKPFHLPELHARIGALARRRLFKGENILQFEEISIFPDKREATIQGEIVELRKKEYELLLFFMVNPDRVLAKAAIAEHLWGDFMDTADSYDFLYNHVKNLRKKISEAGGQDYIKTVYGLGYKFTRA